MPFVRISLPKRLSLEEKDAVSLAVHRSLVQEFHIPENDYFHVIEELEPHQIKFPTSYLGVAHTPEMVYIQVIAGKGRNPEQKKRLYQAMATRVSSSTTLPLNNIIIVLLENEGKQNWSFGNGEIQEPIHLQPWK